MENTEEKNDEPSKSIVSCGGLCISGSDRGGFWTSIILTVVPAGLFFAFVGPTIWDKVHPALIIASAYSIIFTLITLCLAGFTDPGIIPRREKEKEEKEEHLLFQEITLKGHTWSLKYCETCHIYRPPRCSHCSYCNNCVDHFDHHCPWIGNCVGRRNYKWFVYFVLSTNWNLFYVAGMSLLCLILIAMDIDDDKAEGSMDKFFQAVKKAPVALGLLVFCGFTLLSVSGLACYHCFLSWTAQTTHEHIKGEWDDYGESLFHIGSGTENICNILCAPWYPSYMEYSGGFLKMMNPSKKPKQRNLLEQPHPTTQVHKMTF